MTSISRKNPVEVILTLRKTPNASEQELHAIQRFALELQGLQGRGYSGKKILEIVTQREIQEIIAPVYKQIQDMLRSFGGGITEIHPQTEQVVIQELYHASSDPLDKERIRSFQQAQTAIRRLYMVQTYLDVLQEQKNSKEEPDTILKQMRITRPDLTKVSWPELEKDALTTLMQTPSIFIILPELNDSAYDQADKMFLLARTIAQDPQLRLILAQKMAHIQQQSSELAQIELLEEEEILIRRHQVEAKQQDEIIRKIVLFIQKYIPQVEKNQEETLRTILHDNEDVTEATLTYEVQSMAAQALGIDSVLLKDIQQRQKKEQQAETLADKLNDPSLVGSPEEDIQTMRDTLDRIHTEIKTRYDKPEIRENMQHLDTIQALFEKKTQDDQPIPYLQKLIADLFEHQHAITEYKRELHQIQTQTDQGTKRQARSRLQEESLLIDAIEAILPEGILELILYRYEEITVSDEQRVLSVDEEKKKKETTPNREKEKNKETEKNEDTHETEESSIEPDPSQEIQDHLTLTKAIHTRWVEERHDSPARIVHKDRLKADMLTLAYQGEDGIQTIIQRELDITEADTLSTRDAVRIQQGYKMKGMYLLRRILRDFFISRILNATEPALLHTTEEQSSSSSSMQGLRDHEWELFLKHFSKYVEKKLSRHAGAQTIFKKIRSKQDKEPSQQTKFLLFILAMVNVRY